MRRLLHGLLAAVALLTAWPCLAGVADAGSLVPVPPLSAPVTDLTGTLTPAQRQALDTRLLAFSRAKGSQIAVLIVPSTAPEAIEQYSIRVAEAWKLGRKGLDDGVLVLVAKDDHAMRIEVGYGLEGAIPDAVAKRVVAEIMAPKFRTGDFAGGLDDAVDRLIGLVNGEALPPAASQPRGGRGGQLSGRQQLALGVLVLVILAGEALRLALGPMLAAVTAGAASTVLGGLVAGSLAFGVALGVAGFTVVLLGVFNLLMLFLSGGGGGGGRGGGGGDQGFSGGGGGFGGGGASGRW